MAVVPHWPANLRPQSILFEQDIPSSSGGVSQSGEEDIVVSSSGRWRARATFKLVHDAGGKRVLSARAIKAYMKGRSNPVLLGPYDDCLSPGALDGGYANGTVGGISHGDGTSFGDGTRYVQGRTFAALTLAASLYASSIEITMTAGLQPQPGQYFGIGEQELYWIASAAFAGDPNRWTLGIWPTLRNDHALGVEANFDNPTCRMRLASDNSGELEFRRLHRAMATFDFVEALT
jgi:hypothetical protein